MTPKQLEQIKARCEAESDLCENCNIERLCCTCINAPWQLTALYVCLDEIERLKEACRMAYQGLCTDDEEAQQEAIALIDALETI